MIFWGIFSLPSLPSPGAENGLQNLRLCLVSGLNFGISFLFFCKTCVIFCRIAVLKGIYPMFSPAMTPNRKFKHFE